MCGESRMHGVKEGKIWRLSQRITYSYRSQYVGASDIGQCLKKSYLSKFDKEDFDFEQLLIFERGHVAEGIFIKGLENSPKKDAFTFTKQVEFVGKDEWSCATC